MRNLSQWLDYIETAHTQSIDMGLARVRKVYDRLSLNFSQSCIVTTAGTNGKGTTCRFVEQACLKAGYTVGVYSSPHIERFNERIRVQGVDASDTKLTYAFNKVDIAAKHFEGGEKISLSYFEYATLCALVIFAENKLDICLLEVGLGGRLDATNIIDADIGVITSIGLDHQEYLGNTTELIAAEKAGIIKHEQQVVIGYSNVHESVKTILNKFRNPVLEREKNFGIEKSTTTDNSQHAIKLRGWLKAKEQNYLFDLDKANIPAQNVMTAIATLQLIARHVSSNEPLLLASKDIQNLISEINMPGRLQTLSNKPKILLDVAHNEDSAKYLVNRIQQMPYKNIHIIIGMLKDKNIEKTITCLNAIDASWYCVDLPTSRGEKASRLVSSLEFHGQTSQSFENVKLALQQTVQGCGTNDMILVVGSFILASECMVAINELALESTIQGEN